MAKIVRFVGGIRIETAAGNVLSLEGSPRDHYAILSVAEKVDSDADEWALNPKDARALARALLELADDLESERRSECCDARLLPSTCSDPRCATPGCTAPDLACEACGMKHSI